MIDQAKASKLAKEGFDQWQAGNREQALSLYEQAIPLADPGHWSLSAYHGEYASVLNELGRVAQATAQLERSLAVELAQGNQEGSPCVTIARYFLACQLHRQGAHQAALDVLSPSISHAPDDWCTRLAQAHILFGLGRQAEAKAAAAIAVSNAPTRRKADELERDLKNILEAPGG